MTALPLRDFTAAEQDKLAAIEAAPAAEESVTERVARAISEAQGVGRVATPLTRHLADAALEVMRGER